MWGPGPRVWGSDEDADEPNPAVHSVPSMPAPPAHVGDFACKKEEATAQLELPLPPPHASPPMLQFGTFGAHGALEAPHALSNVPSTLSAPQFGTIALGEPYHVSPATAETLQHSPEAASTLTTGHDAPPAAIATTTTSPATASAPKMSRPEELAGPPAPAPGPPPPPPPTATTAAAPAKPQALGHALSASAAPFVPGARGTPGAFSVMAEGEQSSPAVFGFSEGEGEREEKEAEEVSA